MTENAGPPQMWASVTPLIQRYPTILCDLDGVVYVQGEPIPGAPEALDGLRHAGGAPVFVTNNASRSPSEVAGLLRSCGTQASEQEVRTSAQVAARLLRDRLAPGAKALVVGAKALADEVEAVGLDPVSSGDSERVEAVVQGFAPEVGWHQLADASEMVGRGAWWVATNTDQTVPSVRGPLPGNGSLVAVVATTTGRQPDAVAGKPFPQIMREAAGLCRTGAPLMVGDRWDTDIAGAEAADIPGLLVLSGSTLPDAVLRIPAGSRPRFLAWTLAGIHDAHPPVRVVPGSTLSTVCEGWTVDWQGERLTLSGGGETLDALRALAEAAWGVRDRYELESAVEPLGAEAVAACQELGVAADL